MFLSIRNRLASCILMTMNVIGLLLLVATRAPGQVSMTRTRNRSEGEVLYLAVFGRWELRSILNGQGHTLSLLRRSDTMLTTDQASKSTETTNTETGPRLPVV